jgi:hypothetical protein
MQEFLAFDPGKNGYPCLMYDDRMGFYAIPLGLLTKHRLGCFQHDMVHRGHCFMDSSGVNTVAIPEDVLWFIWLFLLTQRLNFGWHVR